MSIFWTGFQGVGTLESSWELKIEGRVLKDVLDLHKSILSYSLL